MIENSKTEIVEEEDISDADNRKIFKIGPIIIGSIIVLMIFCIIMILKFDPEL